MSARLRRDAEAIWQAGVSAVMPDRLVDVDWNAWLGRDLSAFGRVHVLAVGKGALPMARAFASRHNARALTGAITVPHAYAVGARVPDGFALLTAGHPHPDAGSGAAGAAALAAARRLGPEDLLVVLLSGGASALWATPAHGLTLADLERTNRLLLASGLPIDRTNAVRKHLTQLGGGQLALATNAAVASLVLSDVVGDDPSVIGSGPTAGDASTWADARSILRPFWSDVPPGVRRRLEAGCRGELADTPAPGDARLSRSQVRIAGSIRRALRAAADHARSLGYFPTIVTDRQQGEARDVGAAMAQRLCSSGSRSCLLWGGETTVTLRGNGRGGRNQEVALGALGPICGDALLLSAGTDGIDGPTSAAGAFASAELRRSAHGRNLSIERSLDRNDSHAFWEAAGGHFSPGPTHTNVMDLTVGLRCGVRELDLAHRHMSVQG